MASFDPAVPQGNPQSFLNFSQGTDKAQLQPLAEVPKLSEKYVQPDYKSNTSVGQGLKGAGELTDSAVKLTDQVIQQNVDDTLHKGIDDIRDSFGVAQAADQSSGIAKAVGQSGAEGVSLAETDPNAGQPVAINRLGNRVEGLTEAYKQGGLSNSAYYAKLEAYVREVKAQFPGYGDVIDSKVSNIVGTTPANALRTSLLQDVTNLQNKVNAQSDKWTSYEQKNSGAIYQQWPNYDQMKAQGNAPSRVDVETVVGRTAARDASIASQTASLGLEKAQNDVIKGRADGIITTKAADIGASLTTTITNSMNMKTPQDFNQLLQDVRSGKRAPLSPEEKDQVTAAFAQLKQQYGINFDKFVNSPTSPSSGRTVASYSTPESVKSIRTLGMQDLADIEDGLTNEKYGLVTAAANNSKALQDAAENSYLRNDPNAALAGAVRKTIGDQGLAQLYLGSAPMATSTLEGLRMAGWKFLTDGQSSVIDGLSVIKKESNNNGTLIKTHLGDATAMIVHPDKFADPNVSINAVKYLFGPQSSILVDSFRNKNQVQVFNDLVSPTMTAAISKMDKNSQQTYISQVDNWFSSVFNTQADDANQAAAYHKSNNNLKLTYDPDVLAFKYTRSGSIFSNTANGLAGNQLVTNANNSLAGLNSAMQSMKDVFKLQNREPTGELMKLLTTSGIEPGTPMYKAIQEAYIKKNPPKEE